MYIYHGARTYLQGPLSSPLIVAERIKEALAVQHVVCQPPY